ncbi:MAG: choice-of-anchor D domain-containing protein [Myxococcales bacterium]|nr:MAG: choice-of-anchor D domain-containing protein [Myxococcales bacterium]
MPTRHWTGLLSALALFIGLLISCSASDLTGASDDDPPDGDLDSSADGDAITEGQDGDGPDLADDDSDGNPPECEKSCLEVIGELNFGAVPPGECDILSLTLKSVGEQALTVIDVHLTSDTGVEFSIVGYAPNTPPRVDLPPQYVLGVQVQYCPSDIRQDQGMLVIATNDDVRPRVEAPVASGCKGSVTMTVSPEAIGYGDRIVGSFRREFFTIGAEPELPDTSCLLEVTLISLEIEDGGAFVLPLEEVNCAPPFFIEPGDQKVCAVDFRPAAQGEFTETLTVVGTDYAHESPFTATVALSGGGIAPSAAVEPSAVDFGYVLLTGGAVARAAAVANDGTGTLEILSASWVSNPGAFSVHNDPAGKTIAAGDDPVSFAVKFDPTVPGVQVGTLNVTTNDPAHPVLQVSVSGIGVEICPPGMVPDPENPGSPECVVRCEPGQFICLYEEAGWGYRVCQNDGRTLGEFEPCPIAGQMCVDGACTDVPCEPGEHGCYIDPESGLHYERSCLSDASGWGEAAECVGSSVCRPSLCEDPHSLCRLTNAAQGTPCEDGNQCTESDGCSGTGICQGTARACNDDEPCTDDQCIPDQGCVFSADNANDCLDDNPCTSGDHCENGRCVATEISIDCDDDNDCTRDECDPEANPPCRHAPIEGSCEDPNVCTKNDYCQAGQCVSGPLDTCDDENPCTTDACVTGVGCRNTARTGNCEDGDPCTTGEYCDYEGFVYKCTGGTRTDCDDDNPCTEDTCGETGNCLHAPQSGPTAECTDNNVCTLNDACLDGECVIGAGGIQDCNDGNVCTTDSCHPTQSCQRVNNTETCDDGSPCTAGDRCNMGTCRPGSAKTCDDGNSCTTDNCDPEAAEGEECVSTPKMDGTTCSDSDPCTTGDRCLDGVCEPTGGQSCIDDNECTIDGCDDQGCTHVADIGAECEDGNPCTTGDTCNAGKTCQAGPTPLLCPEESDPTPAKDVACRNYYCQSNVGCKWTAKTGPCDDGNPCTLGDYCSSGSCLAGLTANVCSDDNPCTDDSCDPASGCAHVNNAAACSDGNPCTTGDVCAGGGCAPGAGALDCEDGNQCTTDTCAAGVGCQHASRSGQSCDDGNPCTTGETCAGTTCQGGQSTVCNDGNPCTDDSCNPASGCVSTNDNSNFCSDGSECTTDHCVGGVCVGDPVACSDGNVCTTDTCNPSGGCQYANNILSCDDGKYCTISDTCHNGSCSQTTPRICGVVTEPQCQQATCDEANDRCVTGNINQGLACNDPLYCTVNETCNNGACTGGTARDCSHLNGQCKVGVCTESGGGSGACVQQNAPVGTACDDGNGGTIEDLCNAGGVCVGNTTFTNFTYPGPCPGRSDMVKIVGTRSCIDKYESRLCENCSPSGCYGTNEDNYPGCFPNGNDQWCNPRVRACSLAGVTPSRYMTWDQAIEACEPVGKWLCTPSQWAAGCSQGTTYPYGNTYQGQTCNGADYSGSDVIRSTGAASGCVNTYGALDMSGNAWEWVYSDYGEGDEQMRGGGYTSGSGVLTCGYSENRHWDNVSGAIGMRCCVAF